MEKVHGKIIRSGKDVVRVSIECPYCGKTHTHGATKDLLTTGETHRKSHCHADGNDEGYMIVINRDGKCGVEK